MTDSDDELFSAAPNAADASALVSKWLEDSEDENDGLSDPVATSSAPSSLLTRVDGVGLGAEDLNDLVAQRRLDPTERKLKYRMEASVKWKEEREKEAIALAKRIEDDILDEDSRSTQLSKKRSRVFGKNTIADMQANSKKRPKVKEHPVSDTESNVIIDHIQHVEKEVVFDFSSSHTPSLSDVLPPKAASEEKSKKDPQSPKHKHSQKDRHGSKKKHNPHDKKHTPRK